MEGKAVFVIVLFDRAPVVGILQTERVCCAIGILSDDDAIVDTALHVIGAARHQQIGMGGCTRERDGDCIRIVVPK